MDTKYIKDIKVDKIMKQTYMMLGRLKSDCDYYLGYGDRCEKYLWAGNKFAQIQKMEELYKSLPFFKKPKWLKNKTN